MTDIRISEREHGPAGARRYEYSPIYMLRGLGAPAPGVRSAVTSDLTSSIPRSPRRSSWCPFDDLTADVLPTLRVRFEMPGLRPRRADRPRRARRSRGAGARAPRQGRRRRAAVRVLDPRRRLRDRYEPDGRPALRRAGARSSASSACRSTTASRPRRRTRGRSKTATAGCGGRTSTRPSSASTRAASA